MDFEFTNLCNRAALKCCCVKDPRRQRHSFSLHLRATVHAFTPYVRCDTGTRGTSDTVEVASQLMEYFVTPNLFRGNKAGLAIANHTRSESAFAALDLQKQVHRLSSTELHIICIEFSLLPKSIET
jgi:hypothetical protein